MVVCRVVPCDPWGIIGARAEEVKPCLAGAQAAAKEEDRPTLVSRESQNVDEEENGSQASNGVPRDETSPRVFRLEIMRLRFCGMPLGRSCHACGKKRCAKSCAPFPDRPPKEEGCRLPLPVPFKDLVVGRRDRWNPETPPTVVGGTPPDRFRRRSGGTASAVSLRQAIDGGSPCPYSRGDPFCRLP
jgi:hypothetical protein